MYKFEVRQIEGHMSRFIDRYVASDWIDALVDMFKSRYSTNISVVGNDIIDLDTDDVIDNANKYIVEELHPHYEPDFEDDCYACHREQWYNYMDRL